MILGVKKPSSFEAHIIPDEAKQILELSIRADGEFAAVLGEIWQIGEIATREEIPEGAEIIEHEAPTPLPDGWDKPKNDSHEFKPESPEVEEKFLLTE